MAGDDSEKTVEESRGRLFALLEKLDIPKERIETRPYTVMLADKSVDGPGTSRPYSPFKKKGI